MNNCKKSSANIYNCEELIKNIIIYMIEENNIVLEENEENIDQQGKVSNSKNSIDQIALHSSKRVDELLNETSNELNVPRNNMETSDSGKNQSNERFEKLESMLKSLVLQVNSLSQELKQSKRKEEEEMKKRKAMEKERVIREKKQKEKKEKRKKRKKEKNRNTLYGVDGLNALGISKEKKNVNISFVKKKKKGSGELFSSGYEEEARDSEEGFLDSGEARHLGEEEMEIRSSGFAFKVLFGRRDVNLSNERDFIKKELQFSGTEPFVFGKLNRVLLEWKVQTIRHSWTKKVAWNVLAINLTGDAKMVAGYKFTCKEGLQALLDTYANKKIVKSYEHQLYLLKQNRDERAYEWARRLAQFSEPLEIGDNEILEIFFEGLRSYWISNNENTFYNLKSMRDASLRDLMNKLAGVKEVLFRNERKGNRDKLKKETRICNFCHKRGHIERYCHKKKGEVKHKKDLSNVKCYKCHQMGHYANKCPLKKNRSNKSNKSVNEVKGIDEREVINQVDGDNSIKKTRILLNSSLGFEFEAEVDSGTGVHIIPFDLVEKFNLKIESTDDNTYVGANGLKLDIPGKVIIPVFWGMKNLDLEFLVVRGGMTSLISFSKISGIGKNVWSIDERNTSLILGGIEWVKHSNEEFYRSKLIPREQISGCLSVTKDDWTIEEELVAFDNMVEGVKEQQFEYMDGVSVDLDQNQLNRLHEMMRDLSKIREGSAHTRKGFDYKIDVSSENYFIQPMRFISRKNQIAAAETINKLKELKMITKIRSTDALCVSNLTFPRKKDGSVRVCTDYRQLNSVTAKDPLHIPSVKEVQLKFKPNSKYFITLDLRSGFWHLPIGEKYKNLTCFYADDGSIWRWEVMSFGLTNAPHHFRRWMNAIIGSVDGVTVYVDDIHIEHNTLEGLLGLLKIVVDKLVKENVTVNLKKFQMGQKVSILGMIRTPEGLHPDPDKIESIRNIGLIGSKKQLKRVIGMMRYISQHVPNLGEKLKPFNRLTSTKVRFKWSGELQKQLENVIASIVDRVCHLPDYSKDFKMRVDASDFGCGGYLFQEGSNGEENVIRYFSRAWNSVQEKWDIVEREAFALIYGVTKCEEIIDGFHCTIFTDHKPLIYMMKAVNSGKAKAKVFRWMFLLRSFDIDVIHVPGKENIVADTLSRKPFVRKMNQINVVEEMNHIDDNKCDPTMRNVIGNGEDLKFNEDAFEIIATHKLKKKEIPKFLLKEEFKGVNKQVDKHLDKLELKFGRLMCENKFYVSVQKRESVLFSCHKSPMAGHLGIKNTFERISEHLWWPGMRKDVERYVSTCSQCQGTNGNHL